MVCSKCKKAVLPDAKFCGNCGNTIVQEDVTNTESVSVLQANNTTPHVPEILTCRRCGDVVEVGEAFCNKCGNPINSEVENGNVEQLEVEDNKMISLKCPNCGDVIEVGEAFCNKCGYNLNHDANNIMTTNYNDETAEKKTSVIPFVVFTVICLVIMIGCFIGLSVSKSNIYISDDVDDEEIVASDEVKNNPSGKYNTVVISENTYEGVKLSTKKDAIELIQKDSIQQKKNCPEEIKKYEDELINTYGIMAVNLCELDINFAKELVNVTKKVYEEYPMAKGVLTNLTLIDVSKADGYIAAFQSYFYFASSDDVTTYPWVIKTRIMLNTGYYLNTTRFENGIQASIANGHFPKNATIYSPLAHEFAHYLSFLAAMKTYGEDELLLLDENNIDDISEVLYGRDGHSYQMIEEAYNNCKKETGTTLAFDDWRATISGYAVAKDNEGNYIYDETIAEGFHDVYLNGENAADASKYVVAVLKSRLGGEV